MNQSQSQPNEVIQQQLDTILINQVVIYAKIQEMTNIEKAAKEMQKEAAKYEIVGGQIKVKSLPPGTDLGISMGGSRRNNRY